MYGTGMGEGDGKKDVSDQIENEDQIIGTEQDQKNEEEVINFPKIPLACVSIEGRFRCRSVGCFCAPSAGRQTDGSVRRRQLCGTGTVMESWWSMSGTRRPPSTRPTLKPRYTRSPWN